MKNKILLSCMLAASSSALFAGEMGPIAESSSFRPFISGEGLYTWPNIQGMSVSIVPGIVGTPVLSNHGWGGRVAAGLMRAMTDRFAYSGEIGWGYYGHTGMTIQYNTPLPLHAVEAGLGNTAGNMDRWGFDVLAGLLYTQPKYDLYFKAGALFQNNRITLANIILNNVGGSVSLDAAMPEVMPEIKLGAAYHLTEKLLANVSWMYAFGGAFNVNTPYTDAAVSHVGALTAAIQNPSMNTVMFGLEYRFG